MLELEDNQETGGWDVLMDGKVIGWFDSVDGLGPVPSQELDEEMLENLDTVVLRGPEGAWNIGRWADLDSDVQMVLVERIIPS